MASNVFVIKGSGEREKFSEEKVLRSMNRVGVPKNVQHEALAHIKERLHQDISTSEIFSHIKEFLDVKEQNIPSLKLDLKRAIFDLGPTGFPFEKYVAKIFENKGYVCEVGTIIEGDCVTHEIDVLMQKDGRKESLEAKFHNQQGTKTDIQTALYTYARYQDIKNKNNISGIWIFTNTKLSKDVIDYTKCKGMHAIAWNYPDKGNLQDSVEKPNLYPITILTTLADHVKKRLVENGIVLATDFLETPREILEDKYLIPKNDIENSREEARKLSGINGSIERDTGKK